jgi:CBS domain-containing protein
MFTVSEIMTPDPYTVTESANLGDVVALMTEKHIRHIPIVNSEKNLKGLVTHRDILAATGVRLREHASAAETNKIPVTEIMNYSVKTTRGDTNLSRAARYLEAHKFGCLPVVDGENLIGIITDSDFVSVAINLLDQLEAVEPVELG